MTKNEIIAYLLAQAGAKEMLASFPSGSAFADDVTALREAAEMLKDAPEWVNVDDRLPEERDTMFAKFYNTDKWRDTMFRKMSADVYVVREYEDGTRLVHYDHTVDGEWSSMKYPYPGRFYITHWMSPPKLPKKEKPQC